MNDEWSFYDLAVVTSLAFVALTSASLLRSEIDRSVGADHRSRWETVGLFERAGTWEGTAPPEETGAEEESSMPDLPPLHWSLETGS